MLVSEAQAETRTVFLGGFVGQLVSSFIWFVSAAVATWVDPVVGFWTLALGGSAIFPLTQTILRLSGRRASVDPTNPLHFLGMQIAFTVPLALPLAGAAALYRLDWFYPACLIIVGAHYLPFIFLYGMKTFGALAAAMTGAGFALGFLTQGRVVLGGWVGGAILFVFAFVLLGAFRRNSSNESHDSIPGT